MATGEYRSAHDFPPTFLELVSEAGRNIRILDVGGGDRRLKHPGYINLEIVPYDTVDVLGDSHSLPLKSNSFDIVLCQATIEHLRRPWLAAEEMYRVCKVGGFVYVDAAFMQPMHAFPNHFFNTTGEGIRVLFEKFDEIGSGVQSYQMPSYTVYRILSEYLTCFFPKFRGTINATLEDRHVTPPKTPAVEISQQRDSSLAMLVLARVYQVIKMIGQRVLKYLDRYIDPSAAETIAAGVYFLGRKD